MTLGEKIRSLRVQRKMNQDELGQKIGINGRHISRYENDRVQPRPKTLQLMSKVLEVPIDELRGDTPAGFVAVKDPELQGYIEQMNLLDPEDLALVKRMLKIMVTNKQLQRLMAS